ncbi:HNH endonuclease [Salmonella enterica]|uniref:HNH endonuclease n=1 Tax=Salmonella enterica TaxID=28901 RepID=A0A5U4CR04_SALER|nr:HNH endonuclease [Salmonella enterica]
MARFIFTAQMKAWMRANYMLPLGALTIAFNHRFGTTCSNEAINGFRKRLGLTTGRSGCFLPGHVPANKGKQGLTKANRGSFGSGHRLHNAMCPGDEALTKDGYIKVKVAEPDKWELKHRLVWEQHNGEIPKGGVIRFIDDNRLNCVIENLMLVTTGENAVINRWYSGVVPEHKYTVLALARIKSAMAKKQGSTVS